MVSGGVQGVHHVGITVQDVDRSVAFWSCLLDTPPRWRKILDGEYLGDVTGYAGVRLDVAVIPLPGGAVLEILNYLVEDKKSNPPHTANPGNAHICLAVDDLAAMWNKAVQCGATPVSPGPVSVTEGPNQGARSCYLRDPDGITLELLQSPPHPDRSGRASAAKVAPAGGSTL